VTEQSSRPLRVDPNAESAERGAPEFAAPPDGAPVYHGFTVLDDIEVDEFKFGMITDFEAQPETRGDAFVVAPDNSRCGLDWEVSKLDRFEQVIPMEWNRWGVWYVTFPNAMSSRENVRRNLAHIMPLLSPKWEEWRVLFNSGAESGAAA